MSSLTPSARRTRRKYTTTHGDVPTNISTTHFGSESTQKDGDHQPRRAAATIHGEATANTTHAESAPTQACATLPARPIDGGHFGSTAQPNVELSKHREFRTAVSLEPAVFQVSSPVSVVFSPRVLVGSFYCVYRFLSTGYVMNIRTARSSIKQQRSTEKLPRHRHTHTHRKRYDSRRRCTASQTLKEEEEESTAQCAEMFLSALHCEHDKQQQRMTSAAPRKTMTKPACRPEKANAQSTHARTS